MKKAKLKIPGATFDEKLYNPDRQLDIPTIEKLNTCTWIDEGRNLVVTGMTGTGKTYYVNALAVAAFKQFKEVRYYSASKLLLELSAHEQVEDSIKFLGIIENIALSIPLSEVHAIRYRSPHNPLKKSIFFKS